MSAQDDLAFQRWLRTFAMFLESLFGGKWIWRSPRWILQEDDFGYGIFEPDEDPELNQQTIKWGSFAGSKITYRHFTGQDFHPSG